ncbi:MAG: c-type cytochrome [Mizugakiibacter sp.]|uniref:c-type cytochrome n=1 Tax=Mizugakiibacter sp. TaxID=1972610 RepID=UPI0031C88FEE|nr:c-type cytochrome [Xanthomonadaceae bacterium]
MRPRTRYVPRTALAALALGAACAVAAAPALDSLERRIAACTGCHGERGQGGRNDYNPRLEGQPEGYMYAQLKHYQAGARAYPRMEAMVQFLPDAYLHEIAQYFAALPPSGQAAGGVGAAPAVLERGRTLALRGDAARKLDACASCHGSELSGVLPTSPGIAGQPYAYLSAQLGAWQSGTRRAAHPDCMAAVAHRLGGRDMQAVAAWLSTQPARAPQAMDAATREALSRCGNGGAP